MDKVEFQITDGSVEYKHSKPRAEYETVAPLVRLNFTIAEGSDAEAIVRKVMGMAVRHVEGVITGEPSRQVRGWSVEETENKPRRGRPPSKPAETSSAPSVGSGDAAIDEPETVGFEAPETTLTLKGDIQPLAQKVSAHLAAKNGNINELRKIIKECGGNSLLTIPQENWPMFMTKAKELLPAKE